MAGTTFVILLVIVTCACAYEAAYQTREDIGRSDAKPFCSQLVPLHECARNSYDVDDVMNLFATLVLIRNGPAEEDENEYTTVIKETVTKKGYQKWHKCKGKGEFEEFDATSCSMPKPSQGKPSRKFIYAKVIIHFSYKVDDAPFDKCMSVHMPDFDRVVGEAHAVTNQECEKYNESELRSPIEPANIALIVCLVILAIIAIVGVSLAVYYRQKIRHAVNKRRYSKSADLRMRANRKTDVDPIP